MEIFDRVIGRTQEIILEEVHSSGRNLPIEFDDELRRILHEALSHTFISALDELHGHGNDASNGLLLRRDGSIDVERHLRISGIQESEFIEAMARVISRELKAVFCGRQDSE